MTIDTPIERVMDVIMRDGMVLKFREYELGLYYYDMASKDIQDGAKTNAKFTPTTCCKL